MRFILITAASLWVTGAWGQSHEHCDDRHDGLSIAVPCTGGSRDDRLDHAMALCRDHQRQIGIIVDTKGPNYVYPDDWNACYKIETKWQASASGEDERKRKEKEQGDLDFVNSVAKEK